MLVYYARAKWPLLDAYKRKEGMGKQQGMGLERDRGFTKVKGTRAYNTASKKENSQEAIKSQHDNLRNHAQEETRNADSTDNDTKTTGK